MKDGRDAQGEQTPGGAHRVEVDSEPDLSPPEPPEPAPFDSAALTVDESAQSRVAGIVDRARERNLDRAAELRSWVAAAEQSTLTAEDRGVAAEVAHQLAGSAGTFGYLTATDIAREIEGLFAEGEGAEHWTRTAERVQELVSRLHQAPESEVAPTTESSNP